MNKYISDENNRLWYELQGDYYIPCLTPYQPKKESRSGYGDNGTDAIYKNIKE